MSSLRVNYHKSEVIVIGAPEAEKQRIADMLNCQSGTLPIRYLGVPISNVQLHLADMRYINSKIQKRLPKWQSQWLSSVGKSILMESCLSSVPNYSMGVYLLLEGIHHQMDTDRADFFWHGPGNKRKYHMIKWQAMATPKEFGGMGFTETRTMNICLLTKWIFKLENGDRSLCCDLLRAKYLKDGSFFESKVAGTSQFWRGLHSVKEWFHRGAVYILGDGKKIKFWLDTWYGNVPLKLIFPNLFRICRNPKQLVCQVVENDMLQIDFRRNFGENEMKEWEQLVEIVDEINLTDESDKVKWGLEKSGKYTTSSLYKNILDLGVRDKKAMLVWRSKIPMKVRIFLWQLSRDRIKSADQLKKKMWKGDEMCKLCGKPEDASHIIFTCPVAIFQWAIIRDIYSWDRIPVNLDEFWELYNKKNDQKGKIDDDTIIIILGAMAWTLWLIRNDLVFENRVISSEKAITYKMVSLLQRWSALSKEDQKTQTEAMANKIKDRILGIEEEEKKKERMPPTGIG